MVWGAYTSAHVEDITNSRMPIARPQISSATLGKLPGRRIWQSGGLQFQQLNPSGQRQGRPPTREHIRDFQLSLAL